MLSALGGCSEEEGRPIDPRSGHAKGREDTKEIPERRTRLEGEIYTKGCVKRYIRSSQRAEEVKSNSETGIMVAVPEFRAKPLGDQPEAGTIWLPKTPGMHYVCAE